MDELCLGGGDRGPGPLHHRVPGAGAGAITRGESGKRAVAHYAGGKIIRSASVTKKAPTPELSRIGSLGFSPKICTLSELFGERKDAPLPKGS